MSDGPMHPRRLALVAARFRTLGEPARLQLLDVLRRGERTVSELVALTGMGQANVSKHLQVLHQAGFVERRREGLFTRYRIGDEDVFRLCDLVCRRLDEERPALTG